MERVIENRTKDLQDHNEELKQLNTNLQIAKDQSEAAIKTKDRFFSIVAHDLKSPFNTLIGFSELLVQNRDNISGDDMAVLSKEMLKTSENTYKLLQNLLDWSGAQTGNIKMEKQEFFIQELLDEIIPIIKPMARQKNIELYVSCNDSITIYGDLPMINSIIRNLLTNAIKFSNSGSTVTICATNKEPYTEISVIDQGVGITKENLGKLFEVDENISTRGTADEMGTGLGLVLCKEFAQKNEGDISVQSVPGVGSTFILKLPTCPIGAN